MRYLIAILAVAVIFGCGKDKKNPADPGTVNNDPNAPYVEVTYPANAQVFGHATQSIKVQVTATDADGISTVYIYVNAALKAADKTAPYTYTILPPYDGHYRVCAIAYDNSGKQNMDCIDFTVQ